MENCDHKWGSGKFVGDYKEIEIGEYVCQKCGVIICS